MEARVVSRGKRAISDAAGPGSGDYLFADADASAGREERRALFPKGKKAKHGDGTRKGYAEGTGQFGSFISPRIAASERNRRRIQKCEADLKLFQQDKYKDDYVFDDDGVQMEPFNLKQEEEEGFFDESGNFVEYKKINEEKDAWIDSVDVDRNLAEKVLKNRMQEEEYQELSSEDVAKVNRNIADVLQPGETILHALKRLKQTSCDTRGRMPEATRRVFEQLTEDAQKLMENGDYNVYHEERETFEREAEGYERLARAREATYVGLDNGKSGKENIFPDEVATGAHHPSILVEAPGAFQHSESALQASPSGVGDGFDMFGEDDETLIVNPESGSKNRCSGSFSEPMTQPSSEEHDTALDLDTGGDRVESDYIFDSSSGYYYSNSLGYYYDPVSGFYCCASSGKWYSFDDQNGSYVELSSAASVGETAT